jgi:hypothetical protein
LFYVQNAKKAFTEEQHEAILYIKKRRSQRLAINLALSINKVNILNCKPMEGAQNVKVEIITKIKPKGKHTVNQKKKAEEGGSLYYSTNTKSAKIYIASQPLTLINPSIT